jgi:general secretion pathway protein N
MRLSDAGPRTWLLATVAGWALLAWVLALVGMGGRIGKLPDDPSLLRALPDVPKAQPERIGPIAQYAETAQRPLFSEDRRPQPFSLQPQGDESEAQQFEFVLTSVLITPKLQMAIITPTNGGQPIRMKQDEAPAEAQGWRLVSLEPRAATFIGPQGEKRMELRTFDGKGGASPTNPAPPPEINMDAADAAAVAAPAPAPPPAAVTNANAVPQQTGSTLEDNPMTPEQQMDAIRRRIEQRRAQLREEAQQQNTQKTPAQ